MIDASYLWGGMHPLFKPLHICIVAYLIEILKPVTEICFHDVTHKSDLIFGIINSKFTPLPTSHSYYVGIICFQIYKLLPYFSQSYQYLLLFLLLHY